VTDQEELTGRQWADDGRTTFRPAIDMATEYLGFASVTYAVVVYFDGVTSIKAIPVIVIAATAKSLWANIHRKVLRKD